MKTGSKSTRLAALLLIVLPLVTAACGDDDDTDANTSSSSETTAASDPAEDALDGEPAKVMILLDEIEAVGLEFPTLRAAADARADQINADGGLGGSGRPIEVEYCVTQGDPNQATECARKAAGDESVVAVATAITSFGDQVNPVLEEAGIANVGGFAISQSDGASTVSFPIMAGVLGVTGASGTILADRAGAEQIKVAYMDTPGADLSVGLIDGVLQGTRGMKLAGSTAIPLAKPDVSAEVAAVLDDTDGVSLGLDNASTIKFLKAREQLGSDVPFATSGASVNADTIETLGDAIEGAYVVSWFATDDMETAGGNAYLDAIRANDEDATGDDLGKLAWTALGAIDQAARAVDGDITSQSILDALGKITALDTGGLTPELDFTKASSVMGGVQPRLFNSVVVYSRVEDGELKSIDGDFIDPMAPPAG